MGGDAGVGTSGACGGIFRKRHRATLHAPGGCGGICAGRTEYCGGNADGERQNALLQRAGAECGAGKCGYAGAVPLFPTKALAQDQLAELHDLAKRVDDAFGVYTYDGDTPSDARSAIREKGHIVLTQSGHAAHGNSAAPYEMAEAV